jgi:riboflavin kinase/FMN adenylyltransferase
VALHIGPNPTFGENASKVEAHLLDFQGDLYGSVLELEILFSVRGVQKFRSKEELLDQLGRDIATVRSIAGG